MANILSAKKRARQAEKRRAHNISMKSMMRTYIKNVVKAIEAGDKEMAKTAYTKMIAVIDRMASKGYMHKNTSARHKSRLSSHIKAMSA